MSQQHVPISRSVKAEVKQSTPSAFETCAGIRVYHFLSHVIGQNLVTLSNLAIVVAMKARKCNLFTKYMYS